MDGTLLRAGASKNHNVTYPRAQQLRAQLRQDVDPLLAQAKAAEQQPEDPPALPQEMARRETLLRKLDAACAHPRRRSRST